MEAARALAYEPSLAGRTLARGKSDVVVAVVPHTTFGANLQDILEAMTEELARNGLMLVTRFSTSDVTSFDGFIAAVQPVAVVTMAELADDHMEVLRLRRAPLVGAVGTTDEKGAGHDLIGELQARHLFDRGHRQLSYAHLKDRRQNLYGQPRYDGFRTACDQLGLPEPEVIELAIDPEEATAHLRKLDRSTAIACYNDDVALTLLFAAQHLGIAVPEGSGARRSRQFCSGAGGVPTAHHHRVRRHRHREDAHLPGPVDRWHERAGTPRGTALRHHPGRDLLSRWTKPYVR